MLVEDLLLYWKFRFSFTCIWMPAIMHILFYTYDIQSFCLRLWEPCSHSISNYYALMLFSHSVFCYAFRWEAFRLLCTFSFSSQFVACVFFSFLSICCYNDNSSGCYKMSWSGFFFAIDTLILDQVLFLWYLISFMYGKKTEIIKQWFGDFSEAKFCYFGKWSKWSLFQVYTITYSSVFSQCYGTIVLAKVPNIISSYILSQCCWVITIYKYWITKSPAQSCMLDVWLFADCCLCAWLFA
jgi:hypothetical protein